MRLILGLAACLAGTATCIADPPDTVFYGKLTTQQEENVKAWGSFYWSSIETGQTVAFSFGSSDMASHLFNPAHATRATLDRLNLVDAADCEASLIAATEQDSLWEKRKALKVSMTDLKFVTDPNTNPDGTTEHIGKILDAAQTSQVVAYYEGGKLVSEKLPLDVLINAGADPEFANNLSATTVLAMDAIIVAAPGYAANATNVTEAEKLVGGAASRADEVEARVRILMDDMGVQPVTQRYEATFGVYGSLPVIMAYFDDGFALIDGINGNVDGPYKIASSLDARALLAQHSEYAVGTGVKYYNAAGCALTVASTKVPWIPPTPPPTITPLPGIPGRMFPGRPATPVCVFTPPASCTCIMDRVVTITPCPPGAPLTIGLCIIQEETKCTWATGVGGCIAIPPLAPVSPTPPGWPAPAAPPCITTYYWWN